MKIENYYGTNEEFYEEWKDFQERVELIDDYENQSSFFNTTDEKNSEKARMLAELVEQVEELEEPSDSEIFDNIPSILDDAETYEKKYNFVRPYLKNYEILPVQKVKLLVPEVVYESNMKFTEENKEKVTKKAVNVVTEVAETPRWQKKRFAYIDGKLVHRISESESAYMGNFWIVIHCELIHIEEIINEQNQVIETHESVTWVISIICMGKTYRSEVSVKTLLSDVELLKITNDRGYLEPEKEVKKLYRQYINLLISEGDYEQKKIYPSTGWIALQNGEMVYVTDKGVIGRPELSIFSCAPYHFEYDVSKCGSREMFMDFLNLRNLCAGKSENSIFLMYYTVLASLTSIFQEVGHGINFVVALIGATNSQKTSTAIIFSRFFDRSLKAIPDLRFNSTEVAIMEKMETYGDAILLVDDYLPYENKRLANEQLKKSETIIRSYGDRVPRKRSKAYAKATGIPEFSRVKGCCMMTGEVFDTNSESSSTRVIQLNFEPGDVDLRLLSYYQTNLLNVPTFLADFICFVQNNMNMVIETIKRTVSDVRNDINIAIKTPRFRDTYGIMSAAVMLFAMYAKNRGFLGDSESLELVNTDLTAIRSIIIGNNGNLKKKSPASTICYALKRAFVEKHIIVVSKNEAKAMKDFTNVVVDYEEVWCVLPETLYKSYTSLCTFVRKDIIYTAPRELADPLKKENLLIGREENGINRFSHKIKSKSSARFLYLKKDIFDKLCAAYEEI